MNDFKQRLKHHILSSKQFLIILLVFMIFTGCGSSVDSKTYNNSTPYNTSAIQDTGEDTPANIDVSTSEQDTYDGSNHSISQTVSFTVPAYAGVPYVEINGNKPFFNDDEKITTSFEHYEDLDALGRCTVAYANIGKDLMPTEKRGKIGSIKPTGWQMNKYDFVDGNYIYNRCHLIGYQLTGENANEKNLITGTRYLNINGMLPFENEVDDYIEQTNNHVLYRVTPIFEGNNLLANGVLIEAYSVEDHGSNVQFNVYCYNVQPGVYFDYATGENHEGTPNYQPIDVSLSYGSNQAPETQPAPTIDSNTNEDMMVHITNTGKKYHLAGCRTLKNDIEVPLSEAKARGLEPCGVCNPPS